MSNSITVGAPADNREGIFKAGSGVGDVKASGHLSNQVQIEGRINRAPSAPSSAPANEKAQPVTVGDSVQTTEGTATVHRNIKGDVLVTLPSGLQVTYDEAQRSGILKADPTPTADKPTEKAKDAKADTADAPTVDAQELQAHATEINAFADTLETAGINPEDGFSRSVAEVAATGELPEDVSEALIDRFGEEDAQTLMSNAYHHAEALVADAIKGAGLELDAASAAELDALLEADLSVFSDALRGKPARLQQIINTFAASRR